MNRIFFLGVVILIFLAIDYYFFQAVKVSIRGLGDSARRWIKIIYWSIPVISLLISFGAMVLYPEYLSAKVRNLLIASVFIIYISKIMGATFLLIGDIVNMIRNFGQKLKGDIKPGNSISRGEFLAKGALAVGGAHLGIMAYGIISGADDYRVKKVPSFL